jgi:serine/threonine protein kinase
MNLIRIDDPADLALRLSVRKVLGKGSYGCVMSAILDGEVVALKVLRSEHANKKGNVLRSFFQEARTLSHCDHK